VRTIPKFQATALPVGDRSQRVQEWTTKLFLAHLNLLRELDETADACTLQNSPPESLENTIANYTSAIKDATIGRDVIGLAEVVSRFTPREIANMIQETGDSLGEYQSFCQKLCLPYLENLDVQRLIVVHSDSTYAFAKKNKKLGDTTKNSKIISTILQDSFGPEGLNIADQCRAIIEPGGIMNEDVKCCTALLMEITKGLTPPNAAPGFVADPEVLNRETRKVFYVSCSCYNELVLNSGKIVPKQPVHNDNARAVYNHMQPFTAIRLSIGDAIDWQVHQEFD